MNTTVLHRMAEKKGVSLPPRVDPLMASMANGGSAQAAISVPQNMADSMLQFSISLCTVLTPASSGNHLSILRTEQLRSLSSCRFDSQNPHELVHLIVPSPPPTFFVP